MTGDENVRLHAIVSGRVQGVGFRAYVLRKASELGATGWVRNRWDGKVEVVAEGERQVLDKLLVAVKRGPSASMVSDVKVKWYPGTGEFNSFQIRLTYG